MLYGPDTVLGCVLPNSSFMADVQRGLESFTINGMFNDEADPDGPGFSTWASARWSPLPGLRWPVEIHNDLTVVCFTGINGFAPREQLQADRVVTAAMKELSRCADGAVLLPHCVAATTAPACSSLREFVLLCLAQGILPQFLHWVKAEADSVVWFNLCEADWC